MNTKKDIKGTIKNGAKEVTTGFGGVFTGGKLIAKGVAHITTTPTLMVGKNAIESGKNTLHKLSKVTEKKSKKSTDATEIIYVDFTKGKAARYGRA